MVVNIPIYFKYGLPKSSMLIWWFVCMFIHVPRWKIIHNSWKFWHMFTKFDTEMYIPVILKPVGFQSQGSNNQADRLQKINMDMEMDTDIT